MTGVAKVFGIGLSRTGTSSLHDALKMLGYRSLHDPRHLLTLDAKGELALRVESITYDALTDSAVAGTYKTLDANYPGSKFVLTVRDLESWLESCRRFFSRGKWQDDDVTARLHQDLYGDSRFDERSFRDGYERHMSDVRAYFADREEDLLIIDIVGGEGWEKLGPFLGRATPDRPFPRRNRARPPIVSRSLSQGRYFLLRQSARLGLFH